MPPLSGHAGISPATQIWGNSLQDYPSFAGETIGTRIDRDISLIMPLRLRGGYATECHAFSYLSSSSALIFSPPCGSCSVFEVAHCVYKNASNRLKSSANARSAISPAQRADITVEEHQYHCAIRKLKIERKRERHGAIRVFRQNRVEKGKRAEGEHQADNLAELRFEFLSVLF